MTLPRSPEGNLTLFDVANNVAHLVQKNGWSEDVFERITFMASELGEISKEALAIQKSTDPDKREAARKRLAVELFDMLWNVVALGKSCQVSPAEIEQAARTKMKLNDSRDFPY